MMDIDEEDLLRTAANGGSIDFSFWPALLPRIVSRIKKITHHEFPIPILPTPAATTIQSSTQPPTQPDSESAEHFLSPLPSSPIEPSSSSSSQDTNKENTPVALRMNPPPTSVPAPAVALPPGTLPPQIASMLTEITSTLTSTFPKYPPHTLQRLSELVIVPKQHYRTLPTYLHALDRVVHVTSGLNIYPLPPAVPDIKTASLLTNGISDAPTAPSPFAAPGSDEALGGALLTPIPWLQPNHHGMGGSSQSSLGTPVGQRSPNNSGSPNNGGGGGGAGTGGPGAMGGSDLEGEVRTESTEIIDGPNGVGSIETVSVSVNGISSMGARGIGVTQGELLRQEQRAGVVPVSQLVPSHHVHSANPHAQVHRRASASPSPESPSNSGAAGGAAQSGSPEADRKSQSPPTAAEAAAAAANTSTSTSTSTSISTSTTTTTATAPVDADAPVGSVTGADEEKPHARGPEEIGPEDMGPQHGSGSSTSSIGGPGGVEMQGIDVEAAVGRKASSGRGGSGSPPKTDSPPRDAGDKMDVEVSTSGSETLTPKHVAEDQLESEGSKRLRENTSDETVATADAGVQTGTAMDTSTDGKNEGGDEKGAD